MKAAEDYDAQYHLGPDSLVREGVPQGRLVEFYFKDSAGYPRVSHRWWLYIPSQYDGQKPIALMVFQDGQSFFNTDGNFRIPTVLDNLIERKQLPAMAAVFVDPGQGPSGSNRSVEYDTLSRSYVDFLDQEIMPTVRRHVRITADPEGHGIAGYSSGGICAFTAAWQKPALFRKVLSNNGSFVNIRGGGAYPELIKSTPRKPIRVFLQDGVRDKLDGEFSGLDWPAGNKAMNAALTAKAYDVRFVMGEGTHSSRHAGSIYPAALRWLWRDYPR